MIEIEQYLSKEIQASERQVKAAIELLDGGATVPFIARYRKEKTQGLDDTQLRTLEQSLGTLRALEERRTAILSSIESQGKLTPELSNKIQNTHSRQALEDLYLPYRPKRTSKGQVAISQGLEPLADALWQDPNQDPEALANDFLNQADKINTASQALEGARAILMERFSEDPSLVTQLRNWMRDKGYVFAKVKTDKIEEAKKFKDYFDFKEKLKKIAAHRTLALFRGKRAKLLEIRVDAQLDERETNHPCVTQIQDHLGWQHQSRAADNWLAQVLDATWRVRLAPKIQTELLNEIKDTADQESIRVFSKNLQHLLMGAPAGQKVTLGLDPGLRTGVKVAVVDRTGQLIAHDSIFPHAPKNQWKEAIAKLKKLCLAHQIELIAIGDGTASRETQQLVNELANDETTKHIEHLVVSEAGASIYSASAEAAKEFPDLDVSIRGAVSIARRVQDPLAELVKIEPKSIGVGQYQHDVNQTLMAKSLDAVVEDCVNAVGVDANTASVPLLARISGLNSLIAGNIVKFRDQAGPFKNREALKKIPRFGNRTFELAAGFLRIHGDNPLDRSGVHPEAYSLVEQICQSHHRSAESLLGDENFLQQLQPETLSNDDFGVHSIKGILTELEKPGRDPRPAFKTAKFKAGVDRVEDLKVGMILEGVVSNVTNFGAFVNIGVHQDGLVHVSAFTKRFVKDPHDCVKPGDIIQVKVLDVDTQLNRISLSMRLDESTTPASGPKKPKAGQQETNSANEKRQHRHKNTPKSAKKTTPSEPRGERNKTSKNPAKTALPPGKTGTFADLFASALEPKQPK